MYKQILNSLIFFVIFSHENYASSSVSYVTDINVQQKNGIWICGQLKCPAGAFGCQVRRRNDCENRRLLSSIYTCIDKQKKEIKKAGDTKNLEYPRTIDIKLETYDGATADNLKWWGIGGETARGIVPLNQWPDFKKQANENRLRSVQSFKELVAGIIEANALKKDRLVSEKTTSTMLRFAMYGF